MEAWIDHARKATDPGEQDLIVHEVRTKSDVSTQELLELGEAQDCPVPIRVAAIDRLVLLAKDQRKEWEAINTLRSLTRSDVEKSEQIRLQAYQWLADLEGAPVRVRGAVRTRGKASKTSGGPSGRLWREEAAADPSPRIRRFASLS